MPWARIQQAAVRAPFLVSVEYGWTREPLIGGGGHAWYLCLFGIPFHLGDSITWQT